MLIDAGKSRLLCAAPFPGSGGGPELCRTGESATGGVGAFVSRFLAVLDFFCFDSFFSWSDGFFFLPGVMDCNLELSTNKPFILILLTNARGICHTIERELGQEVLTFQTITWFCIDANDCYVFMN